MKPRHRKNLLKLAAYLESLPPSYRHFDMYTYADHRGACALPMSESLYAARKPEEFLNNCGTVACAIGHGPAAGIKVSASEVSERSQVVDWAAYGDRAFGMDSYDWPDLEGPFEYLFGSAWTTIDNHHYGAAARIRHFLDTGEYADLAALSALKDYAPYRKGSRSAKRREIDAQVSA